MWSAEVVVTVAWCVRGGSLGGLGEAVVAVADGVLAFGRTLGGVVHDHHGGFDTRQHAHAALARRLHACSPQLQVIVAGQANKRAPAQRSLKTRPEPGRGWGWGMVGGGGTRMRRFSVSCKHH